MIRSPSALFFRLLLGAAAEDERVWQVVEIEARNRKVCLLLKLDVADKAWPEIAVHVQVDLIGDVNGATA